MCQSKGPSICQKVLLGQNHNKIIKGCSPLDPKKSLHIHLDVRSSPWQTQLWLKWCNAMCSGEPVHVWFTSILQRRALTCSGLHCCLRLSRWEKVTVPRLTVERLKEKNRRRDWHKPRETSTETERQRERWIDLSIVLSTWLIFVFYCFSNPVIWVKVIWIWVRGRLSDRELRERWKRRRWEKG